MSALSMPETEEDFDHQAELLAGYRSCLSYIERLHRLLLDIIKDEFERLRIHDVTGPQALLMFNVGDSEVTIGELKARGFYLGSNASYTIKKLVDGGYVVNERCDVDKRVTRMKLTESGVEIVEIVAQLLARHALSFGQNDLIESSDFRSMERSMRTLEHFWTDKIRYIY